MVKKLLNLLNHSRKVKIIFGILFAVLVCGTSFVVFNNLKTNDNKKEELCLIQFNTNGGTTIDTQKVKCGEVLKSIPITKKDGFKFINWHYAGDIYNFDNPINENIILVAEWEVLEEIDIILVSFNTNGGTLIAPVEVAKGYTVSKPMDPQKKGYQFIRWEIDGKEFDFNTIINNDISLDAKWKKVQNSSSQKPTDSNNASQQDNSSHNSNSSPNQDSCNTTFSGSKSCISLDLSWSSLNGTWYLTGRDDVYIKFSEDSSNYFYEGINFNFSPSSVDYNGGQIGNMSKEYTDATIALYINVTEVTDSSITIDNKYIFYKQKNYPQRIETELDKLFKNLQGTWYLDGYFTDVYVKFTSGTRNGEKVLYYDEHSFCSLSGVVYPSECSGTEIFHYSTLTNSSIGIDSYGWSFNSNILYNSSGAKKLKFSKTPTSTPVNSVLLNKENLNLFIGETDSLTATITPSNSTNKKIIWSSSDTNVATVNSDGNVTAVGIGDAIITVTTEDGNKTDICTVNVKPISVIGISLNKSNLSLIKGNIDKLIATITPSNSTNKNIIWSSSDTNVVTVNSSGKVIAKSKGTAVITVTTEDGSFTSSCEVVVKNPPLTASGSAGLSYACTNDGCGNYVSISISAKGGTETYSYSYTIYKDDVLVGTFTDKTTYLPYSSASYKIEYTVTDSEGEKVSGSSITKITID